jgi:prophage DNA circulation protein
MDAWKKKYRTATFRKVLFFVDAVDESGGRRTAVHEYPGNDVGYVEDLGKRLQTFSITAYVLGADYYPLRDALRDALNKGGFGTLIHPYLGELQVMCQTYRIQETTREGRIARFDITFIQSGVLFFPRATVDTATALINVRTSALNVVNEAFLRSYSVVRQPYAVTQHVEDTLATMSAAIGATRKIVATSADYQSELTSFTDNVAQLAFAPTELIEGLVYLFSFGTLATDLFPATITNALVQYEEFRTLFDITPDVVLVDDDPAEVSTYYGAIAAVISAAGLTALIDYESVEQAEGVQTDLLVKIDDFIEDDLSDDGMNASLRDLRAAIVNDIEIRAASKPHLIEKTFAVSLPTLFISNEVYGTINEEQRIIDRNRIVHPGFAPANQPVELLV